MDNLMLILIIVVITQFVVILGMSGRTQDNMTPQLTVTSYSMPQNQMETGDGCGPVFFAFLLLGGAAIVLIFLI